MPKDWFFYENRDIISDTIICPQVFRFVCKHFFFFSFICCYIDFILIFPSTSWFFPKDPFVGNVCSCRWNKKLSKWRQVEHDCSGLPKNMETAKLHLIPVLQIALPVLLFVLHTCTILLQFITTIHCTLMASNMHILGAFSVALHMQLFI